MIVVSMEDIVNVSWLNIERVVKVNFQPYPNCVGDNDRIRQHRKWLHMALNECD